MEVREDNLKNVGYGILKELYKELALDKFWNWKTRGLSVKYSIDQIFRLLVFSRILYPGSKKKAFDNRSIFFEDFKGFSLDDIYYSLDIIARTSLLSRNGSLTIQGASVNGICLFLISTVRIITLILDVQMLIHWTKRKSGR